MRIVERAAALTTVLAMPAVAYGLGGAAVSLWEGMRSSSADAGVALEYGLALAASGVGTVIAAYLALTGYAMLIGTLIATVARWGSRGRRRTTIPRALAALAPAGWTRITATALGVTLSAGLAGPAFAADADSSPSMGPGWVDAPVAAPHVESPSAPPSPSVATPPEVAPPASHAPPTAAPGPSSAAQPSQAPAPMEAVESSQPSVGWTSEAVATSVGWAPATPPETPKTSSAPEQPESPSTHHASPAAATQGIDSPSNSYVVQSGDSLWRITEALLGSDADTAHIAAAWPVLYEANRDAIGADPSLIHAGLALTVPAGFAS